MKKCFVPLVLLLALLLLPAVPARADVIEDPAWYQQWGEEHEPIVPEPEEIPDTETEIAADTEPAAQPSAETEGKPAETAKKPAEETESLSVTAEARDISIPVAIGAASVFVIAASVLIFALSRKSERE